jgi:hypothetical protein
MGPIGESAIHDIAKAIKALDSSALAIQFVGEKKENHEQARSLLFDILKANGYQLNSKYKAILC